jgi:hypothetical protein
VADTTLRNLSDVPDEWLERIVHTAQLPEGRLLLVVGEPRPPCNDSFGECVPKRYLRTAGRTVLKVSRYRTLDWDVGVTIYDRAVSLYESAPGFLAYLIGHELGHAAACLLDPLVHVQYCLLQDSIVAASDHRIRKWHELPHEQWCDEFGMTVASKIMGKDRLAADIASHVSEDDAVDERNRGLLALEWRESMEGLSREIDAFTRPYRERLIAILQERRRHSIEANADCLTRAVDDVAALFG